MSNSLVIVESPAKAKTIKKYLGKGFSVMASIGHIIDLPDRELGVDVQKNFDPTYVIIKGKNKILKQITDAAATADAVYLAPDPDREGEAIAWHIAERIRKTTKRKGAGTALKIHRAMFNEITAKAIKAAIENPCDLNKNLFEAQQARRVLDRLVGYKISPLLWDKVRRGLSAGRVQSVAVRIVCEREAEIEKFVTREYWSIVADLEGSLPPVFEAKLAKIDGKDVEIAEGGLASQLVDELRKEEFKLASVKRAEKRRNPTPPFITSKLQQEAARKLGFTAKKTMALAQMLYEGIEIGEEGTVGLITYMRTDSIRSSADAIDAARGFIKDRYGALHVPEKPIIYKGSKGAQDAHEAIRPTLLHRPPESVESYLERDAFRLYDLIWKRFIASQMKPAVYDQTAFSIEAGRFLLRATGAVLKFQGFMAVYLEGEDEEVEKDEESNSTLPDLKDGDILSLRGIEPHQHFTQPPPRFTEASLVKELEEKGIGRPSTYAAIMSTIVDKEYVAKDKGRFRPTDLGRLVNELLVESFPSIIDVGFTAQMERELDDVEDGKRGWVETLTAFYGPFEKALAEAHGKMRNVKRELITTEIVCALCGEKMAIKWGRHGEFLACSAYPKCRNTKEFERADNGAIAIKEAKSTGEICEKCGSKMLLRRGKFGEFLACEKYPACKTTKSITTGVSCPQCSEGMIVQKNTRRGKLFFGCSSYPKCDFASWDKPIAEKCPTCGNPILVEKYIKKSGEISIACPNKDCGFKKRVEATNE